MIALKTLTGERTRLVPMVKEHRSDLLAAAADGELWNLKVTNIPNETTIDRFIDEALSGFASQTVLPYVVVSDNRIVGSTRFWKIDLTNKNAEIGRTWLAQSVQRTHVNTEAKFLMLRHAFEDLGLIRVQLTTDVLNERSQRAIERLDAIREGVIRNERIMPDGRHRDSVRYSIIDTDWPTIKSSLTDRLFA